ncbi:MAG: hypothetical protein QXS74_09790 [Nitrososphaeria archaeon]
MPAFKKDLEPVALPDEVIKIIPDNIFYKVKKVVPLPTIVYDFGPMNAGQKDIEPIDIVKDSVKLEMPKNQLAHFRIKLLDDFEVFLKQPKTTSKFTTTHREFYVSTNTPYDNLTEWFQFEDRSAGIIRNNPSTTALDKTRIMLYGFKYELEKTTPTAKYTVVEVGGE